MQANTFQVGDRVQLIPFKHKGKVATVKYFGAIGRKFGTWVGLELDQKWAHDCYLSDSQHAKLVPRSWLIAGFQEGRRKEPTGENSGDVNGEKLFECQPMHGLVLRNTQVKLMSEESVPIQARASLAQLNVAAVRASGDIGNDSSALGDSPLITPRKDSDDAGGDHALRTEQPSANPSRLMQAMTQAIKNPTAVRPTVTAAEDDTKQRGWKERLEDLKRKKQDQKLRQQKEAQAVNSSQLTEEDKLRQSFQAASGIHKNAEGQLEVNKAEVKKGPTGEDILNEAIEDAKDEPVEMTTPQKVNPTTRSSLASISKVMSKPSPAKQPSEEAKAGKATPGLSRLGTQAAGRTGQTRPGATATTKQQELAAKKAEMDQKRIQRQTTTTGATRPAMTTRTSTTAATAASGSTSARSGRTSARPGATPGTTAAAAPTRTTLAQRTAAKAEEEKKAGLAKRPAMSTTTAAPGLKRSSSNLRGSSSTRNAVGGGQAEGQQRLNQQNTAATAAKTGMTQRIQPATRDRTPGPSSANTSKATPLELQKLQNQIKDKEAENLRLSNQVKSLQAEKTTLTKEKAEKEALVVKATKAQADLEARAQKEKDDITAKAEREKETIKKQFQTQVTQLTKQLESKQEENSQLMASQDLSLEKSKLDEENSAMKVVQLEATVEEMNIKLEAQEKQMTEYQTAQLEAETKLTETEIQMAEAQQKIKDQEAKITETETQLAEREQTHAAQIADMETQLAKSQDEIAASAQQWKAQNKEDYKRMEKEIAAKFEETRKTFETSLHQAQDKAKKASDALVTLQAKLDEEMSRRADEAEIFELEKQTLMDEKQELMDRIMEQGKVEEEDPLKDLSLEEIKLQNKKLRQAITALTYGFEEEKRKLENQMKNETGKDKIIADQEKRLEEMDFLLEEVERKEEERADMEEKLEEIVEYENMVEEMVQEIANQEELNEEMELRIQELEEEMQLMEELNAGLELDNTEMQDDLAAKDRELKEAKNEIEQLEGIVIDQDGINQKYKERQQEFQKQIKALSEQLAETVNDDNKDQVSVLLEKQQQLIARLRDAEKKSLQITKSQITMQQERMGIEVVQNMLPETLMNEALLPCLKKIQGLNFLKHKATMLLREICETQVDNAPNVYAEIEQLNSFYQVLLQMSMLSNRLVQSGHRICFLVANMTPGQYAEVTRLLAWDQLGRISDEIDAMLDLLKEENLSYNYDLGSYENQVKQVEQLLSTVEKAFVAFSPEELKAREELGPSAPEPETQTKRKQLLQKCPKLAMREQVSLVAIAITFVPRLSTLYASELERRQVIQKVGLIYWRLLDVVLKLDNVNNTDSGEEYLDEEANSTNARLQQKYDSIKVLWSDDTAKKQEATQKSWVSVLEAIERDVISLNNDFKFKQLAERVEAKYGAGKIDFNDLYNIDYKAGGPWRTVSEQVRSELQDMGALKQKNSNLLEKQKEMLKQMAIMKKEKDEAVFITSTLKGQLSQAVAKADQVPALQIEKTGLEDKVKAMQKQIDQAMKENQKNNKSIADMKKELEEAKKQQASANERAEQEMLMGATNKGFKRSTAIRARQGAKHMSRESGTAAFFKNLQNAGLTASNDPRGSMHQRQISESVDNKAERARMINKIQLTEDQFNETINQLQADRMRLKGKEMLERLNKLQNSEGAFSQITQQLRDQEKKKEADKINGVTVKLNKAEQLKVQEALESVETLKFKVKKQMATRRIVDIRPKTVISKEAAQQQPEEAKETAKSNSEATTETFNCLVMDTREKINEAMKVLFSRDSKLRTLQESTIQQVTTKNVAPAAPPEAPLTPPPVSASSSSLNEVKVGTLKLRSKIKIPQNRVIFDESTLSELRRNVALFSS